MLLAALSWALGNVALKAREWSLSSLALTVWFFVASSLFIWPFVLIFEPPWQQTVPSAPVLTRPEVIAQEQVQVNEILSEYEHPGLGMVRQPRPAARFEGTPVNTEQIAAALGQHGREILTQAGYAEEEIEELIAGGILAEPAP